MKLFINEGTKGFISPYDASKYYYSKWVNGFMTNDEIRQDLKSKYYDDDFIDDVFVNISDRYDEETDYDSDYYDESINSKRKKYKYKLKESESDGNYVVSFKDKGINYYVDLFYDAGNTIGMWWDDSDNGQGYNNSGYIGLINDFGLNRGKFNPNTIQDYIIVDSRYNRKPPMSVRRKIVDKIRNIIDYDKIN